MGRREDGECLRLEVHLELVGGSSLGWIEILWAR